MKRLWCRWFGHRMGAWERMDFDPEHGVLYLRHCLRCGSHTESRYRDEVVSAPRNVPISNALRGPMEGWWRDVIDKHHG